MKVFPPICHFLTGKSLKSNFMSESSAIGKVGAERGERGGRVGLFHTHNHLTSSKNFHIKKSSITEEKYESRFPQKADNHCSFSHSTVAVIADGWKLGQRPQSTKL